MPELNPTKVHLEGGWGGVAKVFYVYQVKARTKKTKTGEIGRNARERDKERLCDFRISTSVNRSRSNDGRLKLPIHVDSLHERILSLSSFSSVSSALFDWT